MGVRASSSGRTVRTKAVITTIDPVNAGGWWKEFAELNRESVDPARNYCLGVAAATWGNLTAVNDPEQVISQWDRDYRLIKTIIKTILFEKHPYLFDDNN